MVSKFKLAAVLAALSAVGLAASAQATIISVDFTISPGGWNVYQNYAPYHLGNDPTIGGTVQLDNNDTTGTSFVGLHYKTGTKTWTLGDIDVANSSAMFDGGGNIIQFNLLFTADRNYLYSNNTVQVNDEMGGATYCNGCVRLGMLPTTGAVPEPASWALLIGGFGLTGAALRRRRVGALAA